MGKHALDVTGLRCPLPLLKAKRALLDLEEGEILTVLATDPGSKRDFSVFIDQTNHQMIEANEEQGIYKYVIRKGHASNPQRQIN